MTPPSRPLRRTHGSFALGLAPALLMTWMGCAGRPAQAPISAPPEAPPSAASSIPEPPPPVPSSTYPAARRDDVVDIVHGVHVPDPYRWLEDAKSDEVVAWTRAEDDLARKSLAALPSRAALQKRLTELFYFDAVYAPSRRGKTLFFAKRSAKKEKAVVYVRPVTPPAKGEAKGERVLFDPNTMSDDGSVSLHGYFPTLDGARVAYKLSQNNSDEATLRVRDVTSGKDLPDVIPGAKYATPSWLPDGSGFYYTRLPTDPTIPVAERPGYAEVRFHKLGDDPKDDELVHPKLGDPTKFLSAWVTRDGRYLVLEVNHGWSKNDVRFFPLAAAQKGRHGPRRESPEAPAFEGFSSLAVGEPNLYEVTYHKGAFYVSTNEGAPRYRLFKVDPKKPERAAWKEIVPERESKLEGVQVIGGHLVLLYLHHATSLLEIHDLDGKLVREEKLPGLGTTTGMTGNPDDDEAYYHYSSYTETPRILATSIRKGGSRVWSTIELPIDTSALVTEQVFVTSKDGTKVSMFVMHRKDAPRDGNRATILHGYGGFNVNLTPGFSAGIAAWLERGGVYAIPNLRGGGEYGEDWHKAGMREKKQNVFDDFVAAAEWLVKNRVTKPSRLAISGGSNGGLLVGAAMTQRPSLFGAVLCGVPLLDMVRYHLFGSGKTWTSEYGSADDPGLFPALFAYSPYHHVKKGERYPALLMLSADSDDRVDPMHARKFVAELQWATASDAPVWLRVEKNAGHGGGDMVKKDVERVADQYAFLDHVLGPP